MAAFTTIDDAGAFYSTLLYTGNDTSGTAITGVGFQPDFTWIKNRDASDEHVLSDSVRGANKYVQTDSDAAEITGTEIVQSFDADGFTIGDLGQINTNTEKFISWSWKAGTTTGIDTTGSSITPNSYSFNQEAGFSIIQYTGLDNAGDLCPHGLGTVPAAIFVKNRDGVWSWQNYMWRSKENPTDTPAPGDDSAYWNYDFGLDQNVYYWNDTDATAVNFSLGINGTGNDSGDEYVAYCWAEKQGFSKFGTFTGNGNADGTFVYLGFRPAWVMLKNVTGATNWLLYNNKVLGYNGPDFNFMFQPDTTAAENSSPDIDLLSNGFKARENNSDLNQSGKVIMYWAFAESPFVNSNGVPTNAR